MANLAALPPKLQASPEYRRLRAELVAAHALCREPVDGGDHYVVALGLRAEAANALHAYCDRWIAGHP